MLLFDETFGTFEDTAECQLYFRVRAVARSGQGARLGSRAATLDGRSELLAYDLLV